MKTIKDGPRHHCGNAQAPGVFLPCPFVFCAFLCGNKSPRPVGTSAVRPEREASWSAERQFRFGLDTGVVAQFEEFCPAPNAKSLPNRDLKNDMKSARVES